MGNCLGKKKNKEMTDLNGEFRNQRTSFDFINTQATTQAPSISNNRQLIALNQTNRLNNAQNRHKFINNPQNSTSIGTDSTTLTQTNDTEQSSSCNISRTTGGSSNILTSSTNSDNFSNRAMSKNKNAYIALFDYEPRTTKDLGLKKGDVIYINDEDKKSNGWWWARLKQPSLPGQQKEIYVSGYVPSKYVARLDSLESQSWYFGSTKRMEAEKLLMQEQNAHGSFLIRISDNNNHAYSLSVRDNDSVKHYRIRLGEDEKYFIAKRVSFCNLAELVSYYSKKADGLWVQLMKPCVRTEKPITEGLTHSFNEDFEVDRNLFKLERRIGQGQFGDVWIAEFTVTKMKVAIKTLKEGMNPNDFKAEAELMRDLCHPKLIQLYALCTTEEPIFIITELMINGSLLDYLQSPAGKRLSLDTLIYIASQIADGMAYLESRNYIHRDLAARNVLVGENNEVKVADFGLARVVKDIHNIYAAREGTKFPIKWTAPEAAIYNKFSIKSDVWSFGIVLTEIITHGRTPYPSMSNQEVLQQVSRGYRMPKPQNCPDKLYQLMLNCWKSSPDERPTFETLKYKLENFFDEDDNKQYRDTNNQVNGMR